MAIEELKEKLHHLIDAINNEILLEDLLNEAEDRIHATEPHELEGLSKEDYDELCKLANEDPDKDTITFDELKTQLAKWFSQ